MGVKTKSEKIVEQLINDYNQYGREKVENWFLELYDAFTGKSVNEQAKEQMVAEAIYRQKLLRKLSDEGNNTARFIAELQSVTFSQLGYNIEPDKHHDEYITVGGSRKNSYESPEVRLSRTAARDNDIGNDSSNITRKTSKDLPHGI